MTGEISIEIIILFLRGKKLPVLEPGDKLLIAKPQTPEPCPENTKRNTPELERKNMLGKLKDNVVSKSKDFMSMITLDAGGGGGGSSSPDKEDKNKSKQPDKNMFFSGDELQGNFYCKIFNLNCQCGFETFGNYS